MTKATNANNEDSLKGAFNTTNKGSSAGSYAGCGDNELTDDEKRFYSDSRRDNELGHPYPVFPDGDIDYGPIY